MSFNVFSYDSYSVEVYFEGIKVNPERITVVTGVNTPVRAVIELPANEYGAQIMPGTRVHAFIKENDNEPVLWFQGSTKDFPSENVGEHAAPVQVTVFGDIGSLMDLDLNYLNIYTLLSTNISHLASVTLLSASGRTQMPVAPGVGEYPWLSALLKTNYPMAGRLYAILQETLCSKPALYNVLRRTNFLDHLMIDFHDGTKLMAEIETMRKIIMKNAGSFDLRQSNMWNVFVQMLKMMFHEVVSVAPMIHTTTKIPKRAVNGYFPTNELPTAPKMWDQFCELTDKEVHTQIDAFVKPEMMGMDAPSCNILWGDRDFTAFTIQPYSPTTRVAANIQLLMPQGGGTVSLLRPYALQTAKDVADSYAGTASKKSKGTDSIFSKALHSRWSEYMTNSEILYNRIGFGTIPIDPTTSSFLMSRKNNKKAATFWDAYCDAQYSHIQGEMLQVTGPFNIRPVCGFPIILTMVDKQNAGVKGYLASKQDTIDFKNRQAMTVYAIDKAERVIDFDFDQPVANMVEMFPSHPGKATKLEEMFAYKFGANKYGEYLKDYNVSNIYDKICGDARQWNGREADLVSTRTNEDPKEYVGLPEALAMNRLAIYRETPDILVADVRFTAKDWEDPDTLPSAEMVESVLAFREYSPANLSVKGKSPVVQRERFYNLADGVVGFWDYLYRLGELGQQQRQSTYNAEVDAAGSVNDFETLEATRGVTVQTLGARLAGDMRRYLKMLDTEGLNWLDYVLTMGRPSKLQGKIISAWTKRVDTLLSQFGMAGLGYLINIPMVGSDKRSYAAHETFGGFIPPVCPIWEGNPSPDRASLLLHYLSMKAQTIQGVHTEKSAAWSLPIDSKSGKSKRLKYADVDQSLSENGNLRLDFIPRPISEKEAIALRRFIIRLYAEEALHEYRTS